MNLETRQWRRLEDLPLDLAYHALFTWKSQAYLFGGYNGKTFVPNIFSLDGLTGKWSAMHCTGQAPPPMCGAATVLRGNEFFVFGGYTEQGHTNDFYRLNVHTRVWTLLPTTNKPLARAYLEAAVVQDTCYIFGGYDGKGCISDFRSINLPDSPSEAPAVPSRPSLSLPSGAPPRLGDASFWSSSLDAQVQQVLSHYARGSEAVNRQQLLSLFGELGAAFRAQQQAGRTAANGAPASGGAGGGGGGGGGYAFDTSNLEQYLSLGFSRDLVLRVLERMHLAGQSTRNVDLVVENLCREDAPPAASPGALDRQHSEREQLKAKMQSLIAEQEESKQCKVCFAEQINCALMDCGHLALCSTCAEQFKEKKDPCPICQRPIRGTLKVFWT